MFNNDPFKIYHDNVHKNIERMKREKKLIVFSQRIPTDKSCHSHLHKRQPLSNITSARINKPKPASKSNLLSTRNLLSKFDKPKREIFSNKSYEFEVLDKRGLNNKYTKIENEFESKNIDSKDPLVSSFLKKFKEVINWYKLSKFQFEATNTIYKEGVNGSGNFDQADKSVITRQIMQNMVKRNYIRPEYSRIKITATHKVNQIGKLSEFMYVVRVLDETNNYANLKQTEKTVLLMNVANCEIKVEDRLNLNDLCYLMDYRGKKLEVYLRWHVVK
ncbi:conserved hypothetical protein [Candida dubliniensis CD36]|uniref:Uncharacterized protein n=1 Tax=Candida dubliniensis (strain CD36 / ATCC MYA-646 / CBS 7987 / NCPF 3949 / NRRL Y-17841) TaxID=573826 RepID=B9W7C2_CANDC|nr:conserved hypothetical protein [Candida dubliniensis CD36]CAX44581.1 conserved hypothetical protein [Candida dubliniensis CD36]